MQNLKLASKIAKQVLKEKDEVAKREALITKMEKAINQLTSQNDRQNGKIDNLMQDFYEAYGKDVDTDAEGAALVKKFAKL
jgi:vacuolar-type H+-ATPase subunit D/Vma8